MTAIGFIWLTFGMSCENIEPTRFKQRNDYAEKTSDSVIAEDSISIYDNPGISFDLEDDGFEEETEDVFIFSASVSHSRVRVCPCLR